MASHSSSFSRHTVTPPPRTRASPPGSSGESHCLFRPSVTGTLWGDTPPLLSTTWRTWTCFFVVFPRRSQGPSLGFTSCVQSIHQQTGPSASRTGRSQPLPPVALSACSRHRAFAASPLWRFLRVPTARTLRSARSPAATPPPMRASHPGLRDTRGRCEAEALRGFPSVEAESLGRAAADVLLGAAWTLSTWCRAVPCRAGGEPGGGRAPKNPDLRIAQLRFLLSVWPRAAEPAALDELMAAVRLRNMALYYEALCKSLEWQMDTQLLNKMRKASEEELKHLDNKLEDAEKNLGESKIRDAMMAKAEYLCRTGDKEGALTAFRKTYDKTVALGHRLDILFYLVRICLFYMDNNLIIWNTEKARRYCLSRLSALKHFEMKWNKSNGR
ncbi:uncharacterized protein AAGF69_010512 isoform 2-T3 [Amazona ochrocephala]